MALLVGALLAFAVGLMATGVGLDGDRAFYPTVMIAIASYYALFAVIGASTHVLVLESLVGAVFLALAARGIFDLVHGKAVSNPGVPAWWPEFCLTFDVTAAGYLAWLLQSGRMRAAIERRPLGRKESP